MDEPSTGQSKLTEGKAVIWIQPSGKDRGPGTRDGVFYNPAMVQNRDLSILMLHHLLSTDDIPSKGGARLLDGMSGTGIRAIRFAKELGPMDTDFNITALDLSSDAVEKIRENCSENDVDIDVINEDINLHLSSRRYSYIDIDPFGTPVPFVRMALTSLIPGGVIGVTATDTAALTGSIPRVGRRRYGQELRKNHYMHELSCRALVGFLIREAAALELSVTPLLFYSSDHFVRGYVRIKRGAKKADASLKNTGWLLEDPPGPPDIVSLGAMSRSDATWSGKTEPIGPVWTGDLEDPEVVEALLGYLKEDRWSYLKSIKEIVKMLERAREENGMKVGGYDVDELCSHLKISPPKMEVIKGSLEKRGYTLSRSRFSDTLIKTDADLETMKEIFNELTQEE